MLVKDMVFLCSPHWFGGVVAFAVVVRCLIVHCVATGWGASYRCTATGAGIGAGGWVWDGGRRRDVVGLLVTLLTAGVVAGRGAG